MIFQQQAGSVSWGDLTPNQIGGSQGLIGWEKRITWSPEEKRKVIAGYIDNIGGCFQKYVEKNCLNRLESMDSRTVLLFFWGAIPPFAVVKKAEEEFPQAA